MATFLILAPFGAFAMLTLVAPAEISLFAGAATALATILYDLIRGRQTKLLASGSVLVFTALGGYVAFVDSSLSTPTVRLVVDGGVLAISLLSIAFRFPFTLQYGREQVDAEIAKLPGFRRANYIITWVWTAAFLAMVIANALTIYIPGLPLWAGLAIALAARNGAALFTRWYPKRRMRMAARNALPCDTVSAS
jgi:hypothetical protein